MVEVKKDVSLLGYNAFHLNIKAGLFAEIKSVEDLQELFSDSKYQKEKLYVLGGGCNTLFTKDFEGLVVKISIPGITQISEDEKSVSFKIGAGEDWVKLVEFSVENNLGGIENMALIPGEVGSAPIQNIAAYGQVLEDVFESLEAYEIKTGKSKTFNKTDCEFKYRTSVFKGKLKGKYIITSVTLKLDKPSFHKLDETYHERLGNRSIVGELKKFAKEPYTIKDVYQAVVNIRSQKYPPLSELGSNGSVFLNPFVNQKKLKELLEKFPNMQYYPVDKMQYPQMTDKSLQGEIVKIPAGWILDELGWRGKRIGNVSTSDQQALVVQSYPGATASEIYEYIKLMQKDFKQATGIELTPEINII